MHRFTYKHMHMEPSLITISAAFAMLDGKLWEPGSDTRDTETVGRAPAERRLEPMDERRTPP